MPGEFGGGFGGVAAEGDDFGGPDVAWVGADEVAEVEVEECEGGVAEFADGVHLSGGDDVIVGGILLEHKPHGVDVFAGEPPVASGVEVSEVEVFLEAHFDACGGAGDFACDEGFAAERGLVVEEDAVGEVEAIGFAVVDDLVEAEDF